MIIRRIASFGHTCNLKYLVDIRFAIVDVPDLRRKYAGAVWAINWLGYTNAPTITPASPACIASTDMLGNPVLNGMTYVDLDDLQNVLFTGYRIPVKLSAIRDIYTLNGLTWALFLGSNVGMPDLRRKYAASF
ncbi:hypothetical protein BDR04DRAFT_1122658 [Suillus decipiens]|nr:hypothetical protein BDR04DRAFT_1122658 [Suillus decipiens]